MTEITRFLNSATSEFPDDWQYLQVSEIGNVRKGKGINRDSVQISGLPCVRYGEIYTTYNHIVKEVSSYISEDTASTSEPIYKGELLFTGSGETAEDIGKVVVYSLDTTGYAGGDILILKPNQDKIEPLFLAYHWETSSIKEQRRKAGQGASIFHFYSDALKKIKIILPPLPEQQKIADILTTVDDHISETEALIEKTKVLKQGLMQQLLTKGIGHTEFKDTEIGRIPVEWEVVSLNDVKADGRYSLAGGPFGSDLKSSDYCLNGVRIIQLQNIGDGVFFDDYKIYTSQEKADELLKCNIYPGDIIIAKMADPVARACIIPEFEDRYLMASDGIRLEVDVVRHDTLFIMYSINFDRFRKIAEQHSTGTTRLRIGLDTLRSLPIALPPLSEQRQIATILTSVDDQIDTYQAKLTSLTRLKTGLMQQLLTGKIRVKV